MFLKEEDPAAALKAAEEEIKTVELDFAEVEDGEGEGEGESKKGGGGSEDEEEEDEEYSD
jgi:hypothetical protein